jgi:hypothetical protein
MNYVESDSQRQAMTAWLASNEFTAFGTLKFTDGYNMTVEQGEQNLRKFFNNLDRLYFGSNLVNAGHRIERAVFMHTGTSRSNLHYHFLAGPPNDTNFFCETARCVWDETSSFTMGYENTLIDDVRNLNWAASYCVHEYQQHGADTLVLAATHSSLPDQNVNPIHAQRRLQKRCVQNHLTKERALKRQIAARMRAANIAG